MSLQLNNKTSFDILRREIERALSAISNQHGLHIRTGSIKYEGHGGECTIQLKVTTQEQPKAASNEHISLLESYGLKDYYNQQVINRNGDKFIVKGINTRCRKSPVILQHANGKGAKCSVSYIQHQCSKCFDPISMKIEVGEPGSLTIVPAPGTIFGTAREIAGGRMWTIHHEGCTANGNFFSGKLPKVHNIVKCNCGQSIQITEALTFEEQL